MKRSYLNRRQRLPFVEPLESRAVLSVCGVTCGLDDGVLSVQGTPADDLIAVRYDSNASSVSVVGRNDEIIGQYPLADVRSLNINGQGGNDQLQVDSQVRQALKFSGADGESSAASAHVHQHGTTIPSSGQAATPVSANYGSILGPALASTLTSSIAGVASSATSSNSSFAATIAASDDHSSHGSIFAEIGLDSHVHSAPFMGGMISTVANIFTLQNHSHAAAYRPVSATTADGTAAHNDSLPVADAESDLDLGGHGRHTTTVASNVSFSKLVPKPCTVSYSGGLVVTSADGKRQCNCDQKKQAAEEIAKQLAGKDAIPGTERLIAAIVDCVPCQQSGLPFGLPAEFQSCSMPPAKNGLPLPILEEHHASTPCPMKAAVEDSEATEAAQLQSLQYVGWPVLAASVAMMPALWERRKDESEAEDTAVPAVDWLFGRFNVELLMAR